MNLVPLNISPVSTNGSRLNMGEGGKGYAWAPLPLVLFIAPLLGIGIATGDFSSMPLNVVITTIAIVASMMNRKEKFSKKIEIFTQGVGHLNAVLVVFVFILVGASSTTAEKMGGVASTVNLGLSPISQDFIIVGLFIICVFVSIPMGTSVRTIAALAPAGFGLSQVTDILAILVMETVVGGAMFGDNLSMISDTTVAAVRTQKTKMGNRFKVNFWTVLPGAILTIIILFFLANGVHVDHSKQYDYNLVKVVPYILVLVLTVIGMNVIVVSVSDTIPSGIISLINDSFNREGLLTAISKGTIGMEDIAIVALLTGGFVGLIQYNGGVEWLPNFTKSKVKSKRGAESGIASLASVVDIVTANNTISIIMLGPLAKNIADEYEVDPHKSASFLDIFAGCFQGLLPYSPQLIAAAGVARISLLNMMPYCIYSILLDICGTLAIVFRSPRLRTK